MNANYLLRSVVFPLVISLSVNTCSTANEAISVGKKELPARLTSKTKKMQKEILNAIRGCDIDKACLIAKQFQQYSTQTYGENDPNTTAACYVVALTNRLQTLSPEQQKEYSRSFSALLLPTKQVVEQLKAIYPSSGVFALSCQEICDSLINSAFSRFTPDLSITQHLALLSMCYEGAALWKEAAHIQQHRLQLLELVMPEAHDLISRGYISTSYSEQMAGIQSDTRIMRLRKAITFFHNEGTKKNCYEWQEHRGRVVLAEDCYLSGKVEEADRMYAKLRSELPNYPSHYLSGWVLFACNRYDARRACERGEYKKALKYCQDAAGDCIVYGCHCPSKPFAMQQILELKAEILSKLGREDEAKQAESDARLIEKNLEKVRKVLGNIEIRIPRFEKAPDGTVRFDFDNPKIIRRKTQ